MHAVHAAAETSALYEPWPHAAHAATDVCPVAALNLPATHDVHAAVPVVSPL